MKKLGLQNKTPIPIHVRGLNNADPVLVEHRDDRISYRSQISIARPEMGIDLVHHDILALRLRHRQSLRYLVLIVVTRRAACRRVPRGRSSLRI